MKMSLSELHDLLRDYQSMQARKQMIVLHKSQGMGLYHNSIQYSLAATHLMYDAELAIAEQAIANFERRLADLGVEVSG